MFSISSVFKNIVPLGLLMVSYGTLISGSVSATNKANRTTLFEIESLPLSVALLQFANEADISISMPPLSFRDGKVQPLAGRHTIDEGLDILLKGTNFTYKIVSNNAVKIYRQPKKNAKKLAVQLPVPLWLAKPLISEIIVSATRRADYIQKIPYAATAIKFDNNSGSRNSDTHSTVAKTAGIVATRQGDGRNKLIIRGISDGAFTGRLQSLVATYLDDSRLTYSAPNPDLALIDIDRVEILRGPQSTLYGSGALTGLYRVVTKEPSLDDTEFSISSSLSLTEYGDPSSGIAAMFNIPFDNKTMAIRAVASYRKNGGYIDDTRLQTQNINSSEHTNGRLSFVLKPSSNWRLKLGTTYRLIDSADSNYYNAAQGWLQRDNYLAEPRKDELFQAAATFETTFGSGIDMVSSTTWTKRDISGIQDASAVIPILFARPQVKSPFSSTRGINTFINETHFSSVGGGRTEWIAGSFISWRDELIDTELVVSDQSENILSSGPEDRVDKEQLKDDLKEIAFFGELTRYLSQDIFITAGLRWFEYNNTYSSSQFISSLALPAKFSGKRRQSGFVPKMLLSWYVNNDHLLYTQVSRGYRLGGVNLPGFWWLDGFILGGETNPVPSDLESFNSDKLTNFELGWKATLLDDNLTLNATAFYADWRKIQAWQQPSSDLPTVKNIGDAHIIGLEFDATYQPDEALQLQVNFSWNKSEITRVTESSVVALGDKLPGAPEFSAYVSARHTFNFVGEKLALAVNYSYTESTDLLFGQQNFQATDNLHLVNLGLMFEPGPLTLRFFIDNLLASRANVFASSNPFSLIEPQGGNAASASLNQRLTPVRPRTFGISASWRY